MTLPWGIIIASSDLEGRRALSNILVRVGIDPLVSSTVRECRQILATERVGLVFCSRILADGNCYDLLNAARAAKKKARIVVTSSVGDWDGFLEAMRLGAFDVIASPCCATDVEWMIIQALRYDRKEEVPTVNAQVAPATTEIGASAQ